jgi:hypothetical protein
MRILENIHQEREFFKIEEIIEKDFNKWPNPEDYPQRVRNRIQKMVDQRRYYWFNNGFNIGMFNIFKDLVWGGLHIIQDAQFAPITKGINARVAFCQIAVELYGSYFTHFHFPEDRVVGGGSDAVYIPWPD